MTEEHIIEKWNSILEETNTGVLSSISKAKPIGRYMTFFKDGMTLYTPTHKDTYKVEDMVTNPHVHVILGYEGEGFGDAYFELKGVAVISTDLELKGWIWNEGLASFFDGPDDPNYIVLVIEPKKITIMNDKDYDGPK